LLFEILRLIAHDLIQELSVLVGVIVGGDDSSVLSALRLPQPAGLQCVHYGTLCASRVAVQQHLAVHFPDTQTRVTILMRWALRHPRGTRTAGLQGASQGISTHSLTLHSLI